MGPMTGRAAGFCAGYSVPGYMNPAGGRGYGYAGFGRGRGFGGGWGRRNWYNATGMPGWQRVGQGLPAWGNPGGYDGYAAPSAPTAEQEKADLKQQAQFLQDSLGEINKRLEELEKEKDD
jgi:hypothetical protein